MTRSGLHHVPARPLRLLFVLWMLPGAYALAPDTGGRQGAGTTPPGAQPTGRYARCRVGSSSDSPTVGDWGWACRLTGDGLPWRSMFTVDHCADQTWCARPAPSLPPCRLTSHPSSNAPMIRRPSACLPRGARSCHGNHALHAECSGSNRSGRPAILAALLESASALPSPRHRRVAGSRVVVRAARGHFPTDHSRRLH